MGDRLRAGKPSLYVTSHPGQLSLAIPPWVGTMHRHTTRYTSPISVVSYCKLVSGCGLRKRISAPPYGPCGLGRTLLFYTKSPNAATQYSNQSKCYGKSSPPLAHFGSYPRSGQSPRVHFLGTVETQALTSWMPFLTPRHPVNSTEALTDDSIPAFHVLYNLVIVLSQDGSPKNSHWELVLRAVLLS